MTDTSPFTVAEHIIDTQYIREYPNATIAPDSPLKLVVKKYTPRDNPNPQPGDVTLIGTHGCGFPKELYEPLWEETLAQSRQEGFRIRAIWIADTAHLGASGIRNESILGDDPSWFDHSRDLLYMVNQFRAEMPQPIIGVGHSLGAGQLVLLSIMHPRLFTSLAIIEPVIAPDIITGQGPQLTLLSLKRRDTWASKEEAIKAARKVYRKWDPRVFDRWVQHGYRSLPTDTHPEDTPKTKLDGEGAVTLASSKYLEVMHYLRPNPSGHKRLGKGDSTGEPRHDPLLYPDIIGPEDTSSAFYRSEPLIAWKMLKHLRPSALYVFGSKSPVSTPEKREKLVGRTGISVGGNGGIKHSRVKEVLLKGFGHQVPLEGVAETAAALGPWIDESVRQWKGDQERVMQKWSGCEVKERLSSSGGWVGGLERILKMDARKQQSKL
ncbi:toxin biosynthesis protein [Aspergillus californicus]